MITTKSPILNRFLKTPFHMSVWATLVSLLLASLINFLFLSPSSLVMTLAITLVIAAPMSYLTIKVVVSMRVTIEDQKLKLILEHERAEILSKFMRDAAHEFKTPLTLMATNLYLAEKTLDPEKKHQYTQHTNQQIQTLNTLLETILILTRLDSTDKATYPRESLKAAELISNIRSVNNTERIKLQVENPNNLPSVKVNLPDLHLAIKYIMDNALRYSADTSEVNVQITSTGQQMVLQITDQGVGMSEETMQHLFDRFYREDDSHTTRGLGLGLAIAKRVIELHDGYIEVQSELGKYTSIRVFLPADTTKGSQS